MTSEIRTNTITSRAGLSTVTFTDSGPMFSGITTFVDNSTFSVGTGGTIHAPATNVMAFGTNSIDAIKIDSSGNVNVTGILTASSISGGVSLTNGSNDRLVTATGAAGLNGESTLSFNTSNGLVCDSGTIRCNNGFTSDVDLILNADHNNNGTGAIIFKESGNEKARITSAGRLGIGENSPDALLHLSTGASATCELRLQANNTGSGSGDRGRINVYSSRNDGTEYQAGYVDIDRSSGTEDKAHLLVALNNGSGVGEKLRITSGGKVNIGGDYTSTTSTLRVIGDSSAGSQTYLEKNSGSTNNTYNNVLTLSSRSTGSAAANYGPAIGFQHAFGGSNYAGCLIASQSNSDANTADLVFYPRNYGYTERVRITAAGQTRLDIASNGNVTEPLRISNSGTNNGTNVSMLFYNGNGSSTGMGAMARIVAVDEGNHDGSLMFETANKSGLNNTTTAHMKLTKDGRLGIGQVSINSIDSKLFIETSGTSNADGITFKSGSGSTGAKFFFATTNPDRSKYIQHSGYWLELGCHPNEGVRFRDAINNVVRFYMNGSSGNYNFTGSNVSDRNLKENIETITTPSIDLIKQVIPRTFKWKHDSNNTPHGGFIAQEMQPLFPKLVNGREYDESKTDYSGSDSGTTGGCNPTGMGFDYNGYTAYLTKAMQELITKVETLEQENIALKERVMRLEG